jgi:hypothetical protein
MAARNSSASGTPSNRVRMSPFESIRTTQGSVWVAPDPDVNERQPTIGSSVASAPTSAKPALKSARSSMSTTAARAPKPAGAALRSVDAWLRSDATSRRNGSCLPAPFLSPW